MQTWFNIGEIVRPRGIKGVVKVRSLTDDSSRFTLLKQIYANPEKVFEIEACQVERDFVYLKFEGIDTVEDAEALRGVLLSVKREQEQQLDDDTNFIVDLIGMQVFLEDKPLGTLTDIDNYGATDIYTLKTESGKVSFPALKKVVKQVSVAENKMILDKKAYAEVAIYEV